MTNLHILYIPDGAVVIKNNIRRAITEFCKSFLEAKNIFIDLPNNFRFA